MFSSTIKIANLDDYILPSQECILPIMKENDKPKIENKDDEMTFLYSQSQTPKILVTDQNTTKITLSDCLACSGCITTAETILQQQQSIDEFIIKTKMFIAISPQSRASLAFHFKISEIYMQKALNMFFEKNFGLDQILDMKFANKLTLEQCYREFEEKYNENQSQPVICSECPGWVCYAEKNVGEDVVPYMSRIKSPQQIMATMVKDIMSQSLNLELKDIGFVCIMPCYDKKVESFRKEFEQKGCKDVDNVLTTTEIIDLIKKIENPKIQSQNINMQDIFPYNDTILDNYTCQFNFEKQIAEFLKIDYKNDDHLYNIMNSDPTSNYYLEYILENASKRLFQHQNLKIKTKQMKNSDFNLFTLHDENDNILLTFAKVYGFKNIQNIIRSIKTKKCKYQYIEIMSCPSGCLNGGGQLNPLEKDLKAKDLTDLLKELISKKQISPDNMDIFEHLQRYLLKENKLNMYYKADYHKIEKNMQNFSW